MAYFGYPRIRDVKEHVWREEANLFFGRDFNFTLLSLAAFIGWPAAFIKLFVEFNLDFVYVVWQQFEVTEKCRHIFASSLPRERLWLAVRLWPLEASGLYGQTCLDLLQKRTSSHLVCYCTLLFRESEMLFLRCSSKWKKSVAWKGYLSLQYILASLYGSWCPELWCIFLSSNGYW